MKKCSVNENHFYGNHLSYCPWCKIKKEKGKDYFPRSIKSETLLKCPPRYKSSQIKKPNSIKQQVSLPSSIQPNPTLIPQKNSYLIPKWITKTLVYGVILFLLFFGGWNLIHDNDEIPTEVHEDDLDKLQEEPVTSEHPETLEIPETYTNSVGMEFVLVPPGEFMIGSSENEEGTYDEEGSTPNVIIEEPYYLGKCEVTQKQWREVMGDNPSYFKGNNLPVEQISWYDVQEFITELNRIEKTDKYRLPSDVEWEYACRAGTSTNYSFGNNVSQLNEYAWYNRNSARETHPVGKKKPNSWGLNDMYGNVWEWVAWNENIEENSNDSDEEQNDESIQTSRGGSWSGNANSCKSTSQYERYPDYHGFNLGFRILMEI